MKLLLLTLSLLSVAMLCSCSSTAKEEVVTLIPFKDSFDWRPYHVTKAAPDSSDGRFRFVAVSKEGDVTLLDLSTGQSISISHAQTMDEIVVSKMPLRITGFDFEKQTADFEWLTTK
jgi:hypothetical protein